MNKNARLEQFLAGPDAPRVLRTSALERVMKMWRPDVSRATFYRWVQDEVKVGSLKVVVRGLYLNLRTHPPVRPGESARFLRNGAVVSLHTVLGDEGVTNNYTDRVYAVVPFFPGERPKLGRVRTLASSFHFYGMPIARATVGSDQQRLDPRYPHQVATPEKALADWLYLAHSPHSRLTSPPIDLDLSGLKMSRLHRLVALMDIESVFEAWMIHKARYDGDPNVAAGMSLTLGF